MSSGRARSPEGRLAFEGVPGQATGAEDDYEQDRRPGGTAILDIDGTLVDTNYQHAMAWYRAFREHGVTLPVYRIHRHCGMGGDQLVAAVTDRGFDERHGDEVRQAEGRHYAAMLPSVAAFDGASELLRVLRDRGRKVVLATSARQDEVDHYLDLLGARDLVDAWTTGDDVRATKPQPDLVVAAMEKAGSRDAVLVGDSTWDVEAAARAGVQALGILTGGFSESELRDAGATAVFPCVADLLRRLDETPLA